MSGRSLPPSSLHAKIEDGFPQQASDYLRRRIGMRIHTFVIGVVFALALFLFAARHPDAQPQSGFHGVLDLTHTSGSLKNAQFDTQIDPPAHLNRAMWTADQIPPERLIAPMVVLDVRSSVADNPDYQIGVEDIVKWEQTNGQIPLGAVVMARTGWDARWFSPKTYRNADSKGILHFPGYSEDSAKFLVEARNVMGLGIDTPSIDSGSSRKQPVEQYTLAHSVYHLENVTNLDRAPTNGAVVVVAPMKLEAHAQAPVRIFALVR
jgi:kynurenine formamidase